MPAPNNKNNPLGLILILLFFVLPLISSVLENIPGFKGASSLISFIIFILIILAIGKSNGKYSELKGIGAKLQQLQQQINLEKKEAGYSGDTKEELDSEVLAVEMKTREVLQNNVGQVSADDSKPTDIFSLATQNQALSLTEYWGRLLSFSANRVELNRRRKYLQVALNGSLSDALEVVDQLPASEKIIIEAGTPLIKIEGARAVREIRYLMPNAYIVADIKVSDLARREVEYFASAGASAATCLGVAPIETIDDFISACQNNQIDSMVDMMNVESPLLVLKKLKAMPKVVILHRGVDETEISKGKMLPYYQIKQIKGAFNVMVAVAGGDTSKEIQSAVFNDADIVVVWKNFMTGGGVDELARNFLREIK